MGRLRMMAAMLAVLSLLIGGLLVLIPRAGIAPMVALVAGAGILLAVTPFEASTVALRVRVFLACLGYTFAMIAAGALAVVNGAPLLVPAMAVALAGAGSLLAIWAFRTRKRLRRRGWQNYYDN